VPAVTIKTSEPVIIENSNIRSASDCIRCRWGNSNLTVRNTTGIGVNPNVAGDTPGRFVDLQFFVKGVVEIVLIMRLWPQGPSSTVLN